MWTPALGRKEKGMKKIFSLVVSLLMVFSLYAQNVKSVGLTDSDVKNWAKNSVSIQKEFEKIGIDTKDSFTVATNEKQKAESILQKYGISSPNSIEKYSIILQSAVILKAESELDEQSKAMMKLMKVDPLGDLKKNINSKDYNVVASNSKAVLKAFSDLDEYDSSSTDAGNSSNSEKDDYSDLSALMSSFGRGYSDYESKDDRIKKEVLKKYDTKKKFKIVKESTKWETTEYIIIQPSEITFSNSTEAEVYAENYTGQGGKWCMTSGYAYLGKHNNNKPFYTWGSGGVLYYSKFPIDEDSGAPDKFIPDEEVTPEIAKKTVLQMYKEK